MNSSMALENLQSIIFHSNILTKNMLTDLAHADSGTSLQSQIVSSWNEVIKTLSGNKQDLSAIELFVLQTLVLNELENDSFFVLNNFSEGDHIDPKIGGHYLHNFRLFIPSLKTFDFLFSYYFSKSNINTYRFFKETQLAQLNVINIDEDENIFLNSKIRLSSEYRYYLLEEKKKFNPAVFPEIPLDVIKTDLQWKDLVLEYNTKVNLDELKSWLKYNEQLNQLEGIKKRIKNGYRALFYGPPGTGKSITAALLGKEFNLPVYRIDISKTVSKYIGETEKNLAKIFDIAENRNWILFFDEADSLFGKRGNSGDAKDRYANQEISYLLQRIENYNGLIILASNLKNNIDEAFYRRFQNVIYFPFPDAVARMELYKKGFKDTLPLKEDIDWYSIAESYELAGGAINNVIQSANLITLSNGDEVINQEAILDGIRKELEKTGKSFSVPKSLN